jgi:ribosomal protein L22
MAEEKKDTEKKQSSSSRSTAKKSSGGSGGTRKTPAKSGGSGGSGGSGTSRRKTGTRSSAKPKAETATRGKRKTAAEATSKTADSEAAETATAKAPAKKAAGKTSAKPKAESDKAPSRRRAAKKEAPERPVVNARARFVRVAPRKARLVADQVRGLPVDDALPLLRFSTRSAAQDIRKLIESAAANAEANHDLVADDLLIKDIHVDEGPTLRRYRPRALGRATRINKRTSHIAVALTPEE